MKLAVVLALLCTNVINAIRVQDIPACAQGCLGNSTAAQTSCAVIDIACLCSSTAYVSALSCCLYTSCSSQEQATAIQFNKQECEAVNETAPDFVGCSPAGLTSALLSASAEQATKSSPSSPATSGSSSLSTTLSGVSVITGDAITDVAAAVKEKPLTAEFAGKPLMTGSCTVPYFAVVTGSAGTQTEYPEIGCSDGRTDCCPYDPNLNAVLTKCPQDYFTTAGGCCPIGYQVYYTAFGVETPCYSDLATKYVPASTPTIAGLTLITDHVFARKYAVVKASSHKGLPLGGLIGITVNAVLFVVLIICLAWFIKRRRARKQAEAARSTTFPPEEPVLQMSRAPTAHELDSPETAGARSAGGTGSNWPPVFPAVSPPAYDQTKGRPGVVTNKSPVPQELPGSTFIHEHHPAFSATTRNEPSSELSPTSPPRTPTHSAVDSDKRSPLLSAVTPQTEAQSPPFVSPLASPKLPLQELQHDA